MSHKLTAAKTPVASSILAQATTINHSIFDALSDSAFIRESQLVQSPKRPDYPAPLPFSAPTLWRKVKAGTFPKPSRLSERVTAWNVGAVRAWLVAQEALSDNTSEIVKQQANVNRTEPVQH